MQNYFIGQSFEWLEAELKICQGDISRGKSLIQWGAGDSQGSSKIQLTPQQRFDYLYAALVAAEALLLAEDPAYEIKYPATNQRVRRTTSRYTWGA